MHDINWQDIRERATWTAVQAYVTQLGTLGFIEAVTEWDLPAIQTIAVSALGAAGAALLSFVKTLAQERLLISESRVYREPPVGH